MENEEIIPEPDRISEQKVIQLNPEAVKFADRIINEAFKRNIPMINMEFINNILNITYRKEGINIPLKTFNENEYGKDVFSRLKQITNIDPLNKQLVQKKLGMIKLNDVTVYYRVSLIKLLRGEILSIDLLETMPLGFKPSTLGLTLFQLEIFQKLIKIPFGLLLVAGPYDSGKSTTLYTILSELVNPEKRICAIEDMYTISLKGVTPITSENIMDGKYNETYKKLIDELVFQKTDIIMFGELNTPEVMKYAVDATFKVGRVIAGIPSNDAIGAISILRSAGIDSRLIASSITGIIGQRLIRKLCPQCKQEIVPADKTKSIFEKEKIEINSLFVPKGCDKCAKTGYSSVTGAFEIIEITPDVRDLIENARSTGEVFKLAQVRTIYQNLLLKAAEGIISLDEVLRVSRTGFRLR